MRIKVDFDLCESNALCEAMAPDVFELSRSGRRYTREELLTDTSEGRPSAVALHDLETRQIEPGVALVTYLSETRYPDGVQWATRSTLWSDASGAWQARFHQGSPLPGEPRP